MPKRTSKKNTKPGLLKNSEPVFLVVAKIFKPHALRGEVSAEMLSDFPDWLKHEEVVYIGKNHSQYTIDTIRKTGKKYLISFVDLNSRDSVEHLRNEIIYIKSGELPSLAENEYYHHDLLGIRVLNSENEEIGSISEIIITGANDVYVITPLLEGEKEILIPAIKSSVKTIDIEQRIMVVVLPEWY